MINLANTALRELRIHVCQTSKGSKGARDFIRSNYVKIKQKNPDFPILIRECQGVQARIWARYGKGFEVNRLVDGATPAEVLKVIAELATAK